ncbi:MAG: hypothetical protein WEB60_07895 [Terrimicrobiaceae bacterium]
MSRAHFRPGTYVFTDIDRLDARSRLEAGRLFLHLQRAGCRVLNNPALVQTRYSLLRSLYRAGVNRFHAYRVEELPPKICFPAFLRSCHEHGKPLSDLIPSWDVLHGVIQAALAAGHPVEHLIVVEYAAEEVRPRCFRKLSAFKIGDSITPFTTVHDSSWLVKAGQIGVATEDDYLWEKELIQSSPYRYAKLLNTVFKMANIDYGRVDFGIVGDQPQIYEINTNPHLVKPSKHPSRTRMENNEWNWNLYLEAVARLNSHDAKIPVPAFKSAALRQEPPSPLRKSIKRWTKKIQSFRSQTRSKLGKWVPCR